MGARHPTAYPGGDPPVSTVVRFWRNEAGATAIEYCLIAIIVSLSIVAGAKGIGSNLKSIFTNVASNFH